MQSGFGAPGAPLRKRSPTMLPKRGRSYLRCRYGTSHRASSIPTHLYPFRTLFPTSPRSPRRTVAPNSILPPLLFFGVIDSVTNATSPLPCRPLLLSRTFRSAPIDSAIHRLPKINHFRVSSFHPILSGAAVMLSTMLRDGNRCRGFLVDRGSVVTSHRQIIEWGK